MDRPTATDTQIQLLGRLVVEGSVGVIDIASRTQRSILTRLALKPGGVVSLDALIDVVWPEDPPQSAVASLQNQIHRLRKLLGSGVIMSSPHGYVLNVERGAIDVHRFEALLNGIRETADVLDKPIAALASINDALALWHGDPLSEFSDEPWARGFVVWLFELRRVAQEHKVEALMALGRGSEAVMAAEMLCDADPLGESAHGLLMRALASTHRLRDALLVFDRFRKHFVTETGLEPSPTLKEIERVVVAQAGLRGIERGPAGAQQRWGAADGTSSNVPTRARTLLGRESDITRVRALIGRHRLVTVTGPGGAGKTRVAIAVGEAELAHRLGGVWFVDLTAVSSGAEVVGAVAGAVGLRLASGDTATQMIGFFDDKDALVILDNCEHVVDTCAMFAERLLASRGSTVMLATSREVLDIEGEHVVVLPRLRCDDADSPGVRLFHDRAVAVNPRFELSETDARTVATLCTRLDGLPLAIELAAARATVMSPVELLAGLDDRFGLLSGGGRRRRRRTLEAALDWSYDLLTVEEQRVLRALGVFVDGFVADAVAAVTGMSRTQALLVIEALVAKSLVDRADQNGEVRFRLLETVKAYAWDRLADAGELAEVRGRHVDHFHRVATVHGRIIAGEFRVGLRLRADFANVTAAFEWAATTHQWTRAGELLQGASSVVDIEEAWVEATPLLERAIEACAPLDVDLTERLKALRVEWQMLTRDPHVFVSFADLVRSPIAVAKAQARDHVAFLSAFGAPLTESLVDWAQRAIERLPAEDVGPVSAIADIYLLFARAIEAAAHGDVAAALPYLQRLTRDDRYTTMTQRQRVVLDHGASACAGRAVTGRTRSHRRRRTVPHPPVQRWLCPTRHRDFGRRRRRGSATGSRPS